MLTEAEREKLGRLFGLVEVGHDLYREAHSEGERAQMIGFGDAAVVFRGEAERLLLELTQEFAGHALTQGGPAPRVVRRALTRSCYWAVHDGHEAGFEMLAELLDNEVADWLVVAENRDNVRDRDLELGACRIQEDLPDVGDEVAESSVRAIEALEPPVIVTTVRACDHESAEIIGRDRFGDARAILAIADTARATVGPKAMTVRTSGTGSGAAMSEDKLNSWAIINKDEELPPLLPSYQKLSQQAGLPHAERHDWGHRTLAAARWYHRAFRTPWYSEAVSAAVSALEVLLVEPGEKKRTAVAQKTTRVGTLHNMEPNEQQRWLKKLYRRRSGALHGGSVMDQDQDVEQLLDLVQHVCRWAVRHLDPAHRDPDAACTTQGEALTRELHA